MFEQATEGQGRSANASLQAGRIEVIGFPPEGRSQAIERADKVLFLGTGERRFPRVFAVGHAAPQASSANLLHLPVNQSSSFPTYCVLSSDHRSCVEVHV